MAVVVSGAVEGVVDQAIFERLVRTVRAQTGPFFTTNGKPNLLRRLRGFNAAARHAPWLILVDLDQDEECAPPFLKRHLPAAAPRMACRVAVRAVEAWLLADRSRFARWLDVPMELIPRQPEDVPDPKQMIVNLARKSKSREVRQDLVPRAGSRRQVGSLYTSRLIGFVQDERRGWHPESAARSADSLDRCLRRLRQVVEEAGRVGR